MVGLSNISNLAPTKRSQVIKLVSFYRTSFIKVKYLEVVKKVGRVEVNILNLQTSLEAA